MLEAGFWRAGQRGVHGEGIDKVGRDSREKEIWMAGKRRIWVWGCWAWISVE